MWTTNTYTKRVSMHSLVVIGRQGPSLEFQLSQKLSEINVAMISLFHTASCKNGLRSCTQPHYHTKHFSLNFTFYFCSLFTFSEFDFGILLSQSRALYTIGF